MKRVLLMVFLYIGADPGAYPQSYSQRHEAYIEHLQQAKLKVLDFKSALRSKNPRLIERAVMRIQADPQAVSYMNQHLKKGFIKQYNHIIQRQKMRTIKRIKQKVAKKYNVRPEDVEVVEFTNPSQTVKAGHDWDLTIRVKNRDLPLHEAEKIAHDSFYEAVGGSKRFPNMTPKQVAETHNVTVTNRFSPEAYEGGKKFLENPAAYKPDEAGQIAKTIEYKTHIERNKAIKRRAQGQFSAAESADAEGMRQLVKQYEKIVEPTVVRRGGRIHPKLKKAISIIKNAQSPAQAEAELAKMGESIESVTQKVSANYEAAHTLKKVPSKPGAVVQTEEGLLSKGAKAVGKIGTGIAIFGTAQEIREGIKKQDWKGVAETGADLASMGLYGAGKKSLQSHRDLSKTRAAIENANRQNIVHANQESVISLIRHGIPKNEALKILNDMNRGDYRSFVRATHQIKKRTGTVIPMPQPKQIELPGPDTTLKERAKETMKGLKEGMLHMGSQAGKFFTDTAKDLSTISSDSRDIVKNLSNISQKNSQNRDQMHIIRSTLIDRGVDPLSVDQALEEYRKGNPLPLRRLGQHTKNRMIKTTENPGMESEDEKVAGETVVIAKDILEESKDIIQLMPGPERKRYRHIFSQKMAEMEKTAEREQKKLARQMKAKADKKIQQWEKASSPPPPTSTGKDKPTPERIVVKETRSTVDEGLRTFVQVKIRFWNVGSQIPGYGKAVMLVRYWSKYAEAEPTVCYGTFSGGPYGIMRFPETDECDAETLKMENGRYLVGDGVRFVIPNPSAFRYWSDEFTEADSGKYLSTPSSAPNATPPVR